MIISLTLNFRDGRQSYMHAEASADPGLSGALALVIDGCLVDCRDMPVTETLGKAKRRFGSTGQVEVSREVRRTVDEFAVAAILADWKAGWGLTRLTVERVDARQGEGARRSFKFGDGYGCLKGCAAGLGLILETVPPQIWKRRMGCTADKNRSREIASKRFPIQQHLFRLVKHDGRAEAALIALDAYQQRTGPQGSK